MECGEVRWTIGAALSADPTACPLCGGELTAERRMPGRRGRAVPLTGERRDVEPLLRDGGEPPTAA
jgi:hypothetical protein